jgi:hypothetical protein
MEYEPKLRKQWSDLLVSYIASVLIISRSRLHNRRQGFLRMANWPGTVAHHRVSHSPIAPQDLIKDKGN